MNARHLAGAVLLLGLAHAPVAEAARHARRAPDVGADLSSWPAVESAGGALRDREGAGDAIAVLRHAGFTSVRLRTWHAPAGGTCGLPATLAMAKRARAAGLSLLLDLHFSDTWADPGHQETPAAWHGLDDRALGDSVEAYARDVVAALVAQDTPPEAVQLGNEIDGGLLWDAGRVGGRFETPAQWTRLGALLARAAAGVRAASPGAHLVLHLANGGSAAASVRWLDHAVAAGVPFDAIGLSYYPWWHGPLDSLEATLAALARRYRRDVMIVETAYPWTLRALDATHNPVGRREQLLPGFPATPEGQAAFARALREAVDRVPDARGAGVWWWEPAWLAGRGAGSPWENCALADSAGRLLPAARELAR